MEVKMKRNQNLFKMGEYRSFEIVEFVEFRLLTTKQQSTVFEFSIKMQQNSLKFLITKYLKICYLIDQGLQFQLHAQRNCSLAINTLLTLKRVLETLWIFRPGVAQLIWLLSPQQFDSSITISAAMFLWLKTVRLRSAVYPAFWELRQFVATLFAVMSKALPVLRVMFSSFGVWSMESQPKNSRELSASSVLKTLTVPLGRGRPNLFVRLLLNYILLAALRLACEYPPAPTLIRLYFRTLTLLALGMNQTCFWEFQLRVTVSLKVYMWQSENDFQEKDGAAAFDIAADGAISYITFGVWLLTVFTSPAISFNLAFSQRLPLLLSMVTQPPISAKVSALFKVTEQSAFHENPVVLQATSQLVVTYWSLQTFQLRVGRVRKPGGREAKLIESMLLKTQIPFLVLRMYPLLQPSRVPLTLTKLLPTRATSSMLLLMYFLRMELVLMRLASQFCSKTLIVSEFLRALKETVQVWMLVETSVKQRSLLPLSKEISRTSLTMANWLLQTVTASETGRFMVEARLNHANKQIATTTLVFILQFNLNNIWRTSAHAIRLNSQANEVLFERKGST